MGAGGSSGQGMVAHQSGFHAMILRGTNEDGTKNWTTWNTEHSAELAVADYDTSPNVMNLLLNQLIDPAGGNIYDGVSAYDPSDDLTAIDTAVNSFDTDVDAIDEDSDAINFFDTARAKAWTADKTDVEVLFDTAAARVLGYTAQVMSQSHAASKANSHDILSSVVDDAITYADDLMDSIGPRVTADLSAAIGSSQMNTTMVLQMALSAALDVTLPSVIDNALAAQRRRALRTHLRGINRFTGGMVDINAVVGSAFVIGMVLNESDFEQTINDFDTQLTLQLYQGSFTQFMETFRSVVGQHIGLYQGHQSVAANIAALGLDAHKADLQLSTGITDITTRNLFDTDVKAKLTESALNVDIGKSTDALLVSSMQAIQGLRFSMRQAATSLLSDYNKARIVAFNDQYDKDLELDYNTVMWDMNMFQQAGNVLSSVTGAVLNNAGKPSRTQSAIAGMASGASAGATLGSIIPGVGTTVGAGVGGLLGAIGGMSN